MNRNTTPLIALSLVAGLATGCLHEDETHDIYLEADGSVTWVITERHVHAVSDNSSSPEEREAAYRRGVIEGKAESAELLAEAGATELESRLLRDARPYEARFSGRFDSLEALSWVLVDQFESELTSSRVDCLAGTCTWELRLPAEDFGDGMDELEGRTPVRFMLAEGAFTDSVGFERITDALVRPIDGEPAEDGELLRWSLTWTQP